PAVGLCLAVLLATTHLRAADEPPPGLTPAEQTQWFVAECTRLGAEVDQLETQRQETETLNGAAARLMRRVRVAGSSTLVYDRLQARKREIDQRNPSDPARRQLMAEHNALYDQYTARMDRLILEEPELQRRQVGSLHELISRGNAAERVWQAQQTRYPLAR